MLFPNFAQTPIFVFPLQPETLIFQNINSVRSNILSLKYLMFLSSGCKDTGIRKFEFMTKSRFLYHHFLIFCLTLKIKTWPYHTYYILYCTVLNVVCTVYIGHCGLKVSRSQAKINENFANYFLRTKANNKCFFAKMFM